MGVLNPSMAAWPDRWELKDHNGQIDVPALDLHLMRMLGASGQDHPSFFAAMADHYKFPPSPFRDANTLLKVMTETSLTLVTRAEFGAILGSNDVAMQADRHYALMVHILSNTDD